MQLPIYLSILVLSLEKKDCKYFKYSLLSLLGTSKKGVDVIKVLTFIQHKFKLRFTSIFRCDAYILVRRTLMFML